MVISALDPVYLAYFEGKESSRQLVPLSRSVEYASKAIVRNRIAHPQPAPRDWRDGRARGLLASGAEDAIKFVASEQLNAIAFAVGSGRPVFVDLHFATGSEAETVRRMTERFTFNPRAPFLYQLSLRAPPSASSPKT